MATLNISTWYLGYFSWRTGLSNPWVEPELTESRFPAPARQQWKLVVTCGWCGGKELFHSSNTAKVIPQVKALNSRWSFQVQTVQTANHDHVFEIAAPNPVFKYWCWSILNSFQILMISGRPNLHLQPKLAACQNDIRPNYTVKPEKTFVTMVRTKH